MSPQLSSMKKPCKQQEMVAVKRFVAPATQKEAADGVLERYSNATNSGSKTELTEMFGLPRPNSLLPMYSDASHSVSPEPLR